MWDQEKQICKRKIGKLAGPVGRFGDPRGAGVLTDEIAKGLAKGALSLGKYGLSRAVKSDWAKKKARELSGKYIDQALDDLSRAGSPHTMKGGKFDIQRQLVKLGVLHMRTPTGKKYK